MHPQESRNGNHTSDLIDEAGDESFPASDPPAISGGMSEADLAAAAYVSKSSGNQLQPPQALSRGLATCCSSSMQRWGLMASAAALGFVVGRLLAGRR
jgi:hypothetical protein